MYPRIGRLRETWKTVCKTNLDKEVHSLLFRLIDSYLDKGILDSQTTMQKLLQMLVGDARRFEQYLFDQQFAHPGWSGMVSVLEDQPQSLLDHRKITLHDFIRLYLPSATQKTGANSF